MLRRYSPITLLICAVLSSCEFNPPFEPQTFDVQGKVEKGPFISGSEITIQPMDEKMQVTGSMFSTYIVDDIGNFALGSKSFTSPYAEFIAQGYFFNEVKGELSNGTLTLRALVDLTDNATVNVNVLTHLKYARIKKLIAEGKTFAQANTQAQNELFEAFGLSRLADKEASSFSIISGTNEAAALIAISSLLLMERSEAAFTEYLSKLSADFGTNGSFIAEINQKQLAADKLHLAKKLDKIKENIRNRYNELGIDIEVKSLSPFIDWDSDGIAGNELLQENQSVNLSVTDIEVPQEGGTYSVQIASPINVYLKPQVEPEPNVQPSFSYSEEIYDLYDGFDQSSLTDKPIDCTCAIDGTTLTIDIAPSQARSNQSRNISLYDYIGNIVASVTITQQGKPLDISVSEAPLLGSAGQKMVNEIAYHIAQGIGKYNVIEQYYAKNKDNQWLADILYPDNDYIIGAWNELYYANARLMMLKYVDTQMLNVYGDYCNVLSALYYSVLVYGWGAVPYINDYEMTQNAPYMDPKRISASVIFGDLQKNLNQAIENLPERKNEPQKDTNGFFFASKDVARILLANILMYQGKHSEATTLLEAVIDNGFYSLATSEVIYGTPPEVLATRSSTQGMAYVTLSDVYLSLAECYVIAAGNSTTAKCLIDDVINAHGLNIDKTDNLLMRIKTVREEILLHGCTYFAFLKRTGLAKEVCAIPDYQLLLPIPHHERLPQNPGY